MKRALNRFIPLFMLAAFTGMRGCATYEFNIIEPADAPPAYRTRKEVVLSAGAIEYHFIAVEDRLVVSRL